MRPIPFLAACALVLAVLIAPVRAEEPADAIQSVIERQLSAFRANDLETAFGFASPSIQQKFGDPQRFGRMVETGYPMVWRPARHQMLDLVQTEMGPVQVVLFQDQRGRLHEAGYLMQQIDGIWRINGVKLRALPAAGA